MRRWIRGVTGALALAGALVPGGLPAAAAAGGDGCAPELKVLPTTESPSWNDGVNDFGPDGLAVGRAGNLPAYWTGSQLHRVPVPATAYLGGIEAVNGRGLMVGQVNLSGVHGSVPFTYRAGDAAITPIEVPTTAQSPTAVDVNDHGEVLLQDLLSTGRSYVVRDGHLLRTITTPLDLNSTTATALDNAGTVVGDGEAPGGSGFDASSVGMVWPAKDKGTLTLGPAVPTEFGNARWTVRDIDEHGRVVGGVLRYGERLGHRPAYWDAPYQAAATMVDGPPSHEGHGTFEAISRTTGLVAGTAEFQDNAQGIQVPAQAQAWPGTGAALTLPRLAAAHPSYGLAASDNGSIGGKAEDATGVTHPVIWTCAFQQGALP
ncbi:hypothetical protein AB0M28_27590 [Streptomyces sp. NPDC051940]|uniref:hypothetical protein n=1 Tax=Streptomyces sp. NPDC051940 TaxID=3155675 RepID=UPI0034147902